MVTNVMTGEDSVFANIGTAALAGAVSGGLAASGVGIVGQIAGNAAIAMANNYADQRISGKTISDIDIGSMVVDGAIGALAGYAGGAGAGNRGLTKLGIKGLKRSWNALWHKGFSSAKDVFLQGLSYFGKNARHMMKPLVEAVVKSSTSVVLNNGAKAMLN